ncbi:MAG: metal ABC transporter ATP-binding protein [Geminicoccaceae bacterium]
MGSIAIALRDVSVRLGGHVILDRIDLDVASGTIHALIGPNGAGKTTLLRSLLSSVPHRGMIRLDLPAGAPIGYVPQAIAVDDRMPMTVGDFISLMTDRRPAFLGQTVLSRRRTTEILRATETDHLIDRPWIALSGGELRRVLLAQALEPEPGLLLLDEPTSQVDENGTAVFERLVTQVRDRLGITVLMVSHDMTSTLRIADTVTAINRRMIFTGPADLFERERREVSASRTEAAPIFLTSFGG